MEGHQGRQGAPGNQPERQEPVEQLGRGGTPHAEEHRRGWQERH